MRFDNKLERINFLMGLMTDACETLGGREFTISSVSEKFEIPAQIIRNDLVLFMNEPFFDYVFIDAGDDFSESEVAGAVKSGKLDNALISFDVEAFRSGKNKYFLPISNLEEAVVGKWFSGKDSLYITKEMPPQPDKNFEKKLNMINEAIVSGAPIHFSYETRDGKSRSAKMRPTMIRMDSVNPENAKCIASNGVIFSINKMEDISEFKDQNYADPERPDLNNDWDAIWGLPSDKDSLEAETWHVVLRINSVTQNIIEKIRSDTKRRKNGSLRKINEDTYIYEDDISGFVDFTAWLWGYGSAIKVLEPKWLADRIKNNFETIRRQYEVGEFID